ncbi:hypothetical protein C9J12_18250 [Photobacterium frigidiphilum]|uniref:Uncharacterized protein n=1 Tax=Photobacterium frigidiphilum TaxID=264736 RepID=A0A2T3JCR3_9GAMM|nr:hypothetical protein [Photobacterium frigidiphilum]PSU46649.1 hypothetical protein C9J12_18250 [Photobacterium frigidiphilum]
MEFIVLVLAILVALILFRLVGFFAPVIILALGIGYLDSKGIYLKDIGVIVGGLLLCVLCVFLYKKRSDDNDTQASIDEKQKNEDLWKNNR